MFEIDFFNEENMNLFWDYVQSLLTGIAPGVMITFALICLGFFIPIIVKAFKGSSNDDDDDDFEYRQY